MTDRDKNLTDKTDNMKLYRTDNISDKLLDISHTNIKENEIITIISKTIETEIYMVSFGKIVVNNETLNDGDGFFISDEAVKITALTDSMLIKFKFKKPKII